MKFLAFDTSTDVMSIALSDGTRSWQHTGPGGAQSSTTLIPAILALLAEAGVALGELDAIAFGRGPGSFTGLRTACAVAQGLAFGAHQGGGVPVLPIDTLMAVAEEARFHLTLQGGPTAAGHRITALLDARMDEMYVQSYRFDDLFNSNKAFKYAGCSLIKPENLEANAGDILAGNVFSAYTGRINLGAATCITALPTASAMLRLAPALAAAGACVPAALALPLYVRDKVALTTDERVLVALEKAQNALSAAQKLNASAA